MGVLIDGEHSMVSIARVHLATCFAGICVASKRSNDDCSKTFVLLCVIHGKHFKLL